MSHPTFSIIIPAYNEERYLPATLDAIARAQQELGEDVEVIVGDNMSTDATRDVALAGGAQVVPVEKRCISAVRNGAARQASGKYLVFNDADNCMSPNMLVEIRNAMDTSKYIGGGVVNGKYDRQSLGLTCTEFLINHSVVFSGVSMFLFYTTPEAFWGVGGFDETLLTTEDMRFAQSLRKLGKSRGQKYLNLRGVHMTMSSRKFDEHGDWFIFRHPIKFIRAMLNDAAIAHEFWYRPNR